MIRKLCIPFVLLLLVLPGCGGDPSQWEIIAQNNGSEPASFAVEMAYETGISNAHVSDLAPGERISLLVGDADTKVSTVTVTVDGADQTLQPDLPLPIGKQFLLVVGSDGKLKTSVSDR